MNQTPIYWKRQNAAYIYADSEWGTAEGDGTQGKPFQTLEQVFEYLNANFYNTTAKTVVLRGYFPLTKTFMDYMCTSFVADKPFEAIVDGMNANGLLYCTNYDGLVIEIVLNRHVRPVKRPSGRPIFPKPFNFQVAESVQSVKSAFNSNL